MPQELFNHKSLIIQKFKIICNLLCFGGLFTFWDAVSGVWWCCRNYQLRPPPNKADLRAFAFAWKALGSRNLWGGGCKMWIYPPELSRQGFAFFAIGCVMWIYPQWYQGKASLHVSQLVEWVEEWVWDLLSEKGWFNPISGIQFEEKIIHDRKHCKFFKSSRMYTNPKCWGFHPSMPSGQGFLPWGSTFNLRVRLQSAGLLPLLTALPTIHHHHCLMPDTKI